MWYLDRFSLTPFDERYLKVPYEWMEFSYLKFMETIDPEKLRDWYLMKKAEEKKNENYEEELQSYLPEFKKAQYTEDQIKDIMQAFRDTK